MNLLIGLIVVGLVIYMFSGKKRPKSGSISMPKVVSDNKLVFGLLGGFALCWFMNNNLVEGIAARGWIRGGLPTRDLIRDQDYFQRHSPQDPRF